MKNSLKFIASLSFAGLACVAQAQMGTATPTTGTMPTTGMHGGQNNPCAPIFQACKGAGYVMGQAKEGNGLIKDCVMKIAKDPKATVARVTVTPEMTGAASACQAKMEKMEAHHHGQWKNKGTQGAAAAPMNTTTNN